MDPWLNRMLRAALQDVSDKLSAKHRMGVAISVFAQDFIAQASAGCSDAALESGPCTRPLQDTDSFGWGSVTKSFTAAAVLQLVEIGAVSLDAPAASYCDPFLARMGQRTLSERIAGSERVRVRDLLHMASGVGDFDSWQFADYQFRNPSKDLTPDEMLNWVPTTLEFAPGSKQKYSTANYVLLGLVLAQHYVTQSEASGQHLGSPNAHNASNTSLWRLYDQSTVLPPVLRGMLSGAKFPDAGTCARWMPVHGFIDHVRRASNVRWECLVSGGARECV